jgi:hypothetical protein
MKRVFLFVRSILEFALGGFLWLGFVRFAFMGVVEIVLCVRYPTRVNLENTAGDTLAALIVFLIAWWLTRDGRRTWARAR